MIIGSTCRAKRLRFLAYYPEGEWNSSCGANRGNPLCRYTRSKPDRLFLLPTLYRLGAEVDNWRAGTRQSVRR